MPYLARKADKPTYWSRATEPERWSNDNFAYEVLVELADFDQAGVSFWEINTTGDLPILRRIAAALEIKKQKIQKAHFFFVDRAFVEGLGVRIDEEPGDTPDREINQLHRNLWDLTGPQAVAVARALASERSVPFPAREIEKSISEHWRSGDISMTRSELSKNIVKKLWDQGAIDFQATKPSG